MWCIGPSDSIPPEQASANDMFLWGLQAKDGFYVFKDCKNTHKAEYILYNRDYMWPSNLFTERESLLTPALKQPRELLI